jgi:pimeloyl-ACP methyl ester carboxylesterase/predicted Zn-dependent protease
MPYLAAALVAGLLSQPVQADSVPLYPDLGDHHHQITTSSPEAQRYFDQGLRLVYGFNHPEAIRSFRQAQRLDSACAMCYWGEALALGPNINVPMDSASGAAAYAAIQRALTVPSGATARERAYIRALATRYGKNPTAARRALDSAYARAMGQLARQFPSDDDAAVLHAEARMLLGPWDYWLPDKRPKAHGAAALAALEPVVARSPRHAGACHFFIHTVEAAHPQRAVPCAERLPELMPGAGHVVHMPAHIYIRVGRYADAIERNVHALHADAAYLPDMAADGVYRLALHPHNGHFLSFAAAMIGRSAQAMESALLTKSKVDQTMMRAPGLGALQHYYMLPVFTMVRFGMWDSVLAVQEEPEDLPYPRAIRHWARALAFAAKKDVAQADGELSALRRVRADPRLSTVTIWDLNSSTVLLDIAIAVATGEIALARGDAAAAVRSFRRGVQIEDALTYDEPPPWHQPVRQQLGKALLAAGRPAEAEAAFRRDLERHPENGWSLHGLATALSARGRTAEAEAVRERFEKAWAGADVRVDAGSAASTSRQLKSAKLANGITIRYVEAGDARGEPIILLHGFTDSWFSYSLVLDGLAAHGRVLAVSLRGHDGSAAPIGSYTPPRLAVDVVAFMDALGLERASIVGHSMGSFVAQHVAASVPHRVHRLVLIGSAADSRNAVMRQLEEGIRAFTDHVPAEFVREFQYGSVHQPMPEEFMVEAVATSLRVPLHVWRSGIAGLTGPESPAALERIAAPTLILWGENDGLFARADQEALTARIKDSRLVVYPETGHTPHWERTEWVVRDIAAFLHGGIRPSAGAASR